MKSDQKQSVKRLTGTVLSLLAAFGILVAACKSTYEEQIADQRFLVNNLQINATSTLPLLVGRDSLLSVTRTPESVTNDLLAWTSDNAEIATVDDKGRVKALKTGTANVSVSSTDGSGRKYAIVIQVIDRIEFTTGITASPSTVSIFESDQVTVNPTIVPANATYKTLKWSSSNNAVATVTSSGVISGLSKGNAVITVASTDGSGIKTAIPVEVKEVIPITDVQISTQFIETVAIGQTTQLAYKLTPTTATAQSVRWVSSNAAIATISETGLLRGVSAGNVTITAQGKLNSAIRASINVNVEAGKVYDTFIDNLTPNWITPTSGATAVVKDNKLAITMALSGTNRRGDFRRTGGATLHAGNYPILAFKFKRPLATGGNVILDTNLGRYQQHVSNGNNQMTVLKAGDDVEVFYANIAEGSFSTALTKLSTTATTTLTTFGVVVADFPSAQMLTPTYEVHWIRSFKTVAELEAFIKNN